MARRWLKSKGTFSLKAGENENSKLAGASLL
jgi:hypothetical protein